MNFDDVFMKIPDFIVSFMKKRISLVPLYVDGEFKCPYCFVSLEDSICPFCNKKFSCDVVDSIYLESLYDSGYYSCYFYYFDIDSDLVINIVCYNFYYSCFSVHHDFSLYKRFLIKSDSVFDICDQSIVSDFSDFPYGITYTDNLYLLKDGIYKYSNIWNLDLSFVSLYELTLPIFYKEFEYLVKYGLYNLAFSGKIIFNGSFFNTFGVDKRYLNFMALNDISYEELEIFRIFLVCDIDFIRRFSFYSDKFVKYKNYNIKDYLFSLKDNEIFIYLEYLDMVSSLGLDLKNKKILCPLDLSSSYDKLFRDFKIYNDSDIDNRIRSLSGILELNRYEDDEYVIYPAPSISSLIEESRMQSNCVRTYCSDYSNNLCNIYFMRRKDNLSYSFVTIEVCGDKVVSAYLKYNREPDFNVMSVIKKFESNLIFVD